MKLTIIKEHPETRVKPVPWRDSVHLMRASEQWDGPLFRECDAMARRLTPTDEEVRRGCMTTRILAWEEE